MERQMAAKSVEEAFETWLKQPRSDLTLRQQFWLAFEAGASFALAKVTEAVKHPGAGASRDE